MKAKLPTANTGNGKNLSDTKYLIYCASVIALGVDPREVVTLRMWMAGGSKASRVYATIWTGDKGSRMFNGHGHASGYGYCKRSAAVQSAIDSAGITLTEDISGRGMTSVDEALTAIARALGFRKTYLVKHE